ncbi:hypothetical protein D3C75_894850 [compost metagenome]
MQGTFTELVTQAAFQTTRQTLVGDLLEAGSRGVETLGVLDPPLGVGIDHHRFLFQGKEALGRGVQGHQAGVELAHLVDVRNLHMQARLDIGLNHTTESQHYRTLGLGHDVEAVPGHDRQHHANDQGDQRFIAHQRLSLVRNCVCCCCSSAAARLAASLAEAGTLTGTLLLRLPSTILSSGRYSRLLWPSLPETRTLLVLL